jgi:hypothetical protein
MSVKFWWSAALMSVALAGCGGGDDDGAGDGSGPDGGGGAADGAAGCAALVASSPPWLGGYLEEVTAKLSGAAEIAPDVTLSDRASAPDRAAARDYLAAQLDALGLDAQLHDYGDGTNVWATLAGNGETAGTVVVGAHYDTVANSPGADDNATGVAVAVATARHLSEIDCRQRDVIVALFDQEEIGLVGSGAFADLLVAGAVDVSAVHTIDQLGWDEDGDGVIELEKPGPGVAAFYGEAAMVGDFDVTLVPTATPSSDHEAFRQAGMNAVGVTEEYVGGDTTPYFHTPNDTIDTLDLDYLSESARLVLFVIARQARGL